MAEDFFLKRISDIIRLCDKYSTPKFSLFLDVQEQAILKRSEYVLENSMIFGGYDGAERAVFGVFPYWEEPNVDAFPISVLYFKKKYQKEISHRNYLGTILSLGLERTKIGDILTSSEGAYVFVSEDIADFVADNIKKVAGCGVDIEKTELSKVSIPEKKFEQIDTVAASARLDAVLAGLLKISRSEAKSLISAGRVMVNHFEKFDSDFSLSEGDLLSVRGFGRAELAAFGNETRSGRIHIKLKKYI